MSVKSFFKNAIPCGTVCMRKEFLKLAQKRYMGSCSGGSGGGNYKGLVLGAYLKEPGQKHATLTPSAQKFDDRVNGKLAELCKTARMSGVLGKGRIFNNVDPDFRSVAVVGLGREGASFNECEMLDEGMENVRIAAGVGSRSMQLEGCTDVHMDGMDYPEQAAEGSALSVFRYHDNKRKQDRTPTPKLELYDSGETDAWTRGLFKAEAQNIARRLSDAPANQMTPTEFAKASVEILCPCGLTVEIRTMEWIEGNHLNSFLMIAKGSCEPPIFMEISYCGTDPKDKPILLLGKGLTFNSGGINLKKCKRMDDYRASMAGAAVVVAALRGAAMLSLPINVTAVIPLCENMPSGMACKPGDFVTLRNGKTMVIRDLDQAGVAVLADPLLYGQATYKPRLVVDVATLGEGVVKGLGGGATGIFSNSHYIWKQFQRAGSLTGDRVWRLPLWHFFSRLVTNNDTYDLTNDGSGPASSCLSAAVLNELVPCADWAHLDIRGITLSKAGTFPYLLKDRMTGRPTRTMIQFLYQMACPDAGTVKEKKKKKKCGPPN